jgi:hypothetical protein
MEILLLIVTFCRGIAFYNQKFRHSYVIQMSLMAFEKLQIESQKKYTKVGEVNTNAGFFVTIVQHENEQNK